MQSYLSNTMLGNPPPQYLDYITNIHIEMIFTIIDFIYYNKV